MRDPLSGEAPAPPELDLEADRLRALMRASVFKKKHQPVTVGRFEIVRLLGSGATGMVYEAIDPRDDEAVAIKVLRSRNPRALSMFKKEFRALSRLSHPNLVTLYELGRAGQKFFFSMELVRGIPLQRYLWGLELPEPSAPTASESLTALSVSPVIDFVRLRDVFGQLCTGVSALHQAGKLHRDIKPSNALVTSTGRLVLMDFGFVSEQGHGALESTHGNFIVGTPAFMSPEQARAAPPTPTSDWYSVGATLYMVLSGQPPFFGLSLAEMMQAKQTRTPTPPRALVRGIPEDIDALCTRLVQPDPEDRPDEQEIFRVFNVEASGRAGTSQRITVRSAGSRPLLSGATTDLRAGLEGRDDELRALAGAYERVNERGLSAVLVAGRAGLGKTTLLRHFTNRLRDVGDAVILKTRCYERDAVPYKALDGLVDALARYLKQLPDARARALLPEDVSALVGLFPVLMQVRALSDEDGGPRTGDRDERRRRAFAAFREILRRIGERDPLILWVDDLQWGDVESATLLADFLRPPGVARLLLLLSFRSEDERGSEALAPVLAAAADPAVLARVERLELSPLRAEVCLLIARKLLAARAPEASEATAEAIAQESQGSPLYVHELVRFVEREVASAQAEGRPPKVSLEALLHVRIAQLPAPNRRLLGVLAVAGRPLELSLALAAGAIEEDARAVLQHLINEELVRRDKQDGLSVLSTTEERVRAAALAQLDGVTLRAYHERLADLIERGGAGQHEILAEHLRAAGQLARAQEHMLIAARAAAAAGRYAQAAEHYQFSLELCGDDPEASSQLRRALGDALAMDGRWSEAAAAFVEAVRDADEPPPRLLGRAALLWLAHGRTREGRAALDAALQGAGLRAPGRGRVVKWLRRGSARLRGYDFRERPAQERALEATARVDVLEAAVLGLSFTDLDASEELQIPYVRHALDLGDPLRVARALAIEALADARRGADDERVQALLERAGGLLERRFGSDEARRGATERIQALHQIETVRALVAVQRGAGERAREACEECERGLVESLPDDAWGLNSIRAAILMTALRTGRLRHLRELRARYGEIAKRHDDRELQATLRVVDAWLALTASSLAEAARWLDEARAHWTSAGPCVQLGAVLLSDTFILLGQRDRAGAWRHIREAWPRLANTSLWRVQWLRVDALFTRALAAASHHVATSSVATRKSAERDLAALEREAFPGVDGLSGMLHATLHATSSPPEAAAGFELAARALASVDLRLHAAVAAHARARLLGDLELERAAVRDLRGLGVRSPNEISELLAPVSAAVVDS